MKRKPRETEDDRSRRDISGMATITRDEPIKNPVTECMDEGCQRRVGISCVSVFVWFFSFFLTLWARRVRESWSVRARVSASYRDVCMGSVCFGT
jgi:hypothetical protein